MLMRGTPFNRGLEILLVLHPGLFKHKLRSFLFCGWQDCELLTCSLLVVGSLLRTRWRQRSSDRWPVPHLTLFFVNRPEQLDPAFIILNLQPRLFDGRKFGLFSGLTLQFAQLPLSLTLPASFSCLDCS